MPPSRKLEPVVTRPATTETPRHGEFIGQRRPLCSPPWLDAASDKLLARLRMLNGFDIDLAAD